MKFATSICCYKGVLVNLYTIILLTPKLYALTSQRMRTPPRISMRRAIQCLQPLYVVTCVLFLFIHHVSYVFIPGERVLCPLNRDLKYLYFSNFLYTSLSCIFLNFHYSMNRSFWLANDGLGKELVSFLLCCSYNYHPNDVSLTVCYPCIRLFHSNHIPHIE